MAVAVLVVAAAGLVVLVGRFRGFTSGHRAAAAWTALLVIVAVGVLTHWLVLLDQYRLGRQTGGQPNRPGEDQPAAATLAFRRRGLKAAVMGADGRVSTSKAQVAVWTAAVVYGLVDLLLLARSLPGGGLFTDAVTRNWRPEYLVLLGLPAAAATVVKMAVSNANGGAGPRSSSSARPIEADAGAGGRLYIRDPVPAGVGGILTGLAELVTDEDGVLAWPDFQYVVFGLITLVNFVVQLLASPTSGLPPVPAALLTLMGVSGSAYTVNKVLSTQGTAVEPVGRTLS